MASWTSMASSWRKESARCSASSPENVAGVKAVEDHIAPGIGLQPHARAKKLPRAAECPVYSLKPSGVLAENHPKNRGFVSILRGQKCLRRGQKCLKRRFFTAISRWRVVSRRALDASGF